MLTLVGAGRIASGAQQQQQLVPSQRPSRASSPTGSRISDSNDGDHHDDDDDDEDWPHADDVMDWRAEDVVLFLQAKVRGNLSAEVQAGLVARRVDGAKLLGRGAILARTEIGVKSAREWAKLMRIIEELRRRVGASLL